MCIIGTTTYRYYIIIYYIIFYTALYYYENLFYCLFIICFFRLKRKTSDFFLQISFGRVVPIFFRRTASTPRSLSRLDDSPAPRPAVSDFHPCDVFYLRTAVKLDTRHRHRHHRSSNTLSSFVVFKNREIINTHQFSSIPRV